jgi:hypothetical protein
MKRPDKHNAFRADPAFLAKIEAWRRSQDHRIIPTRSAAYRLLIERGLAVSKERLSAA